MKTFVLIVSRQFPKTHKRAGDLTFFSEKIECATFCPGECDYCDYHQPKIHTIRGNYPLWKDRINQIQEGKAILSIRYWSGKPYNSKQVKLHQLDKDSGIGIQKLDNPTNFVWAEIENEKYNWEDIAKNDGLSFDDFCDWFNTRQKYPMAIIHFTNFRYNK